MEQVHFFRLNAFRSLTDILININLHRPYSITQNSDKTCQHKTCYDVDDNYPSQSFDAVIITRAIFPSVNFSLCALSLRNYKKRSDAFSAKTLAKLCNNWVCNSDKNGPSYRLRSHSSICKLTRAVCQQLLTEKFVQLPVKGI